MKVIKILWFFPFFTFLEEKKLIELIPSKFEHFHPFAKFKKSFGINFVSATFDTISISNLNSKRARICLSIG